MTKRRKRISRAVWRASHAAWPAAATAFRGMAGRAMTALRLDTGPSSGKGVRRVIFACVRNAGRSQMAVAFFNQLADPQRARAISAGTAPSGTVDPKVIEAMREMGIDLSPSLPRRLNAPLAMAAGHLVDMGCGAELPFFAGVKLEEWPVDDPKGQPVERVREIRDDIRRRVTEMIEAQAWGRKEG
jgi:arsenate reductase (thioredoxin)